MLTQDMDDDEGKEPAKEGVALPGKDDKEEEPEEDVVLLRDCLQRQLDELSAIELIYAPPSHVHMDETARGTVMLALAAAVDSADYAPPLSSFALPRLTLAVGTSPCLGIALPSYYPREGMRPALRWKEGGGHTASEKEAVLQRLEQISQSYDGVEHVLPLVQEFLGWVEEQEEARKTHAAEAEADNAKASAPPAAPHVLGRRLIYFHHLINKHKREFVVRGAVAHGLGGYSKYGWPGVVVVEGEEEEVQAYVRLLQQLRWQEIRVRGEAQVVCGEGETVDDVRKLQKGFEELGEHDMSVLAQNLRAAGLEDLFRTLMK